MTAGRFAAPELLQLGRPPSLAMSPYETLLAASKANLVADMAAINITYDVGELETDPAIVVTQAAVYRDMLRRQEIDDAVANTFLGSAIGALLDQRAADYGVLRRVVFATDPTLALEPVEDRPASDWTFLTSPARWAEPDESLRTRARLAWEALSTAGPAGAYVFHALDADPDVLDAVAYGPETGHVGPGEALIVVQSRSATGLPTAETLDVIAARLDAYEVIYSNGARVVRPVRDDQSARPLGVRVTVASCQPIYYTSTATLFVRPDGDREALRLIAEERLAIYQERRRRIGVRVSREGRIAVLGLADSSGLPVIEDVEFIENDVVPGHMEIAIPSTITITTEVR